MVTSHFTNMHREYHCWHSWRLNRPMEMLIHGHGGAKVLVFPTRDGRFYEYEKMRITDSLRHKIDAGQLQLFCVDNLASESFYCWWAHPAGRMYRHWQYEEYILNEVLPFMNMKNNHPCTISHGCSLGAFVAASIAFRHPHLFQKLAAFSGRYDLTLERECFYNLLDGYYDDSVYYHMPSHFLPNLNCHDRLRHLRKMDIVFTIGHDDPFKDNNEHLSHVLHGKGISHRLIHWNDRAHSGFYWRRMAPLYL